MRKSLYFIAILPSNTISDEVIRYKKYAAEKFNSSHALNSPPHLTLIPPFAYEDDAIEDVVMVLNDFINGQNNLLIQLSDFEKFSNRVIYIQVNPNSQLLDIQIRLLRKLNENLNIIVSGKHEFNPHVTVAFKDLSPEFFTDAWNYYSKIRYSREFAIDNITLLRHEEKKWHIYRRMNLIGT